jgi:hypothetical protein
MVVARKFIYEFSKFLPNTDTPWIGAAKYGEKRPENYEP